MGPNKLITRVLWVQMIQATMLPRHESLGSLPVKLFHTSYRIAEGLTHYMLHDTVDNSVAHLQLVYEVKRSHAEHMFTYGLQAC